MQSRPRVKLVFFGTPEFAVPALAALIKSKYDILVITRPDKPVGRNQILTPPPVKLLAQKHKLPVLQPSRLNPDELQAFGAAVGVVVAYGKIIPQSVLDIFPRGILNIHPSLLPAYRGPSPIQSAILNGDEKTGISIMLLDADMDHGPILEQKEVGLKKTETAQSLHDTLSAFGAELLIMVLADYLAGRLQAWQQDHSQASYTKMIRREDGQLDWAKPAVALERQFRAFSPWPGVWTTWQNKRLKITKIGLLEGKLEPKRVLGEVFLAPNSCPAVATKKGGIVLRQLQLEGKQAQDGKSFVRGYPEFVGSQI